MKLPLMGTHALIDQSIKDRMKKEKPRDYMGGSVLGTECDRKLWYDFHTPKPITDPRIQRIFDLGFLIEDYLIRLLREAGLEVFTENSDGTQFGFIDGPIAGHIDGVVLGLPESKEPHLLEFKSAKSSRFKQFQKDGCRTTEIKYWVQCQVYMLKFNLTRCLFIVLNKDTSELYFERMSLDKNKAEFYIMRGKDICEMKEMPDRKYKKSTFFKCKFCNHNKECWT